MDALASAALLLDGDIARRHCMKHSCVFEFDPAGEKIEVQLIDTMEPYGDSTF